MIGTPGYLPPERLRGEPATRASDMWSLGATLYTALTGHSPRGPVPAGGAGVLGLTIAGLLRPDPRARLTAEQATELLGRGPLDPPSHSTRVLPSRRRRWSRGVSVAAAVLGVAAAVALIIALSDGSPGAQAARIPPGYRLYTDSAQHFSVAIPDDWVASTEDGLRVFCAPAGCPEVVVAEEVPGSDPVTDIDKYPLASGDVPAAEYSRYHRLSIRPVSYDAQAAEAEFTVVKQGFPEEIEGMVRLFTVTEGGQEYYVQTTAPATSWPKALPVLTVFFATFRPVA